MGVFDRLVGGLFPIDTVQSLAAAEQSEKDAAEETATSAVESEALPDYVTSRIERFLASVDSAAEADVEALLARVGDDALIERAKQQAESPPSSPQSPLDRIQELFGDAYSGDVAALFRPLDAVGETEGLRARFLETLNEVRRAQDGAPQAPLPTAVPPLDPTQAAETVQAQTKLDTRV